MQIDEIDRSIIELLIKDARMSYSEIAKQLHLSRAAVRNRVIQLEEAGVIKGFTVQINSALIGKPLSVFFEIKIANGEIPYVAEKLKQFSEVAIIAQHSGKTNLHIHAFFDSIASLESFVNKQLHPLNGVEDVESYILIRNYKTNAYLV